MDNDCGEIMEVLWQISLVKKKYGWLMDKAAKIIQNKFTSHNEMDNHCCFIICVDGEKEKVYFSEKLKNMILISYGE